MIKYYCDDCGQEELSKQLISIRISMQWHDPTSPTPYSAGNERVGAMQLCRRCYSKAKPALYDSSIATRVIKTLIKNHPV